MGIEIARQPIKTIILCWIIVLLSGLGFLRFRQEKDPLKLWVPPDSTFVEDTQWLKNTFQRGFSEEIVAIVADDVLTPATIKRVFFNITVLHRQNISFENITILLIIIGHVFKGCYKIIYLITELNFLSLHKQVNE